MAKNGHYVGPAVAGSDKRAAVFVCHAYWDLCASRISFLREVNPEIPIHCILAGNSDEHDEAEVVIAPRCDSLWACAGEARWQWQHTDLVIRDWYRNRGRLLAFDVIHVIQWDLLLFSPLRQLYAHVPRDAVALTGLTPLDAIASRWHWTTVEPHRSEMLALLEWAHQRWKYYPRACLGPGVALPRAFLDRYANEEIPVLGHDEVRLPLFGHVFGFRLVDTGFYPEWFHPATERVFNANGGELSVVDVRNELAVASGWRAFHPCRASFSSEVVRELAASTSR
jgi:hypothetical protein